MEGRRRRKKKGESGSFCSSLRLAEAIEDAGISASVPEAHTQGCSAVNGLVI